MPFLGQCQKGRMLRAPGKSQAPDLQSGAPPMAVHLDMDSILFQPVDELFDAMYYPPTHPKGLDARRHLQSMLLSPIRLSPSWT
jgi:hypothetical protein